MNRIAEPSCFQAGPRPLTPRLVRFVPSMSMMNSCVLPATDFDVTNGHWEGILPKNNGNNDSHGNRNYSSLATNNITHLDAAFYTNHTFAMYTSNPGDMVFNGCVVSRNEAIIYCSSRLVLNYDLRLLDASNTFGFYLPKTWAPIQVLVWGVSPVSN